MADINKGVTGYSVDGKISSTPGTYTPFSSAPAAPTQTTPYQYGKAPAGYDYLGQKITSASPTSTPPPGEIYGTNKTNTYVTSSPEVQAEMQKYPGLTPEAAIGNVTMRQARSGVVTTEPAQTYIDKGMEQNKIDQERFETPVPEIKTETVEVDKNPAIAALDKEYADYIAQIEAYRVKADQQNVAMIDSIRSRYSDLREEQKIANNNRLKAQEILGTRSGRQRYAPEIQEGILSAEEKAGLKRLSDLQREEQTLVMQAQAAHDAKDFEALSSIFSLKIQNRKDQNDMLNQMYERAYKQETLSIAKAQAKREEKKDILADLQTLGTVGQKLNAEEATAFDTLLGMKSGFTASYIEYQGALAKAEKDKLSLDTMSKAIDMASKIPAGESITLPDGTTIKGMKEVDPLKGINTFRETDNQGNITEIYTSFNPETGRAEVLDIITYPGIGKADKSAITDPEALLGDGTVGALNVAINSLKFSSVAAADAAKATLSTLVAAGDIDGAKEFLITQIKNTADTETARVLDQKSLSIDVLESIRADMNAFEAAGGDFNVFTGLSEKALEKGGFVKDPKLAEIANRIAIAIVDYRKAVSGAAFTESEAKVYDNIFPSIGKTKELNDAKIDSLIQTFKQYEDNFLKNRIGERNYKEIFSERESSTPSPLDFANPNAFVAENPNYKPQLDDYYDLLEKAGINEISDEDLNNGFKMYLERQGASFNKDLSKSLKGPKLPVNKTVDLGGVEGTITGYGSKLWKPGLDFVVSGGYRAPVTVPFVATVVDVVSGYSNTSKKPLKMSEGKKQNKGFGNQVKVRLQDGSEIWLSHLDSVNVKKGQVIKPGIAVGRQGNTGSTYGNTGIHVDITGKKPDGSYYTAEEVAKLFKSFS